MKLVYNAELVMGKKYPKMQNLYARCSDVEYKGTKKWMKYNTNEFKVPAFGYVTDGWVYTEKIDGMNIRIKLKRVNGHIEWKLCGRTDKADIPQDLLINVETMLTGVADVLYEQLMQGSLTLYGEGYGPGIQKGGGDYRSEKGFVLFDVFVHTYDGETDGFFMPWSSMCMWAEDVGLDVVKERYSDADPDELDVVVRNGFHSYMHCDKMAEGIIARQRDHDLYFYDSGSMKRLMFKLKTKDFPPYDDGIAEDASGSLVVDI